MSTTINNMIKISEYIDNEGINQADLARMCELTRAAISKRIKKDFTMRSEMRGDDKWLVFNSPKEPGTDIGHKVKDESN